MSETRTDAVAPAPPSGYGADVAAFTVDGVAVRWGAVWAFAHRRGDWQILDTEVRQALACEQVAAAGGGTGPLGQGPAAAGTVPPGEAAVREEAREVEVAFRRARRLHSAEDLEGWLAERDLTVRQWRRCMRGEALRRRYAAQLDRVVDERPADADEAAVWRTVWGVCWGVFSRWAADLATRVAAAHAVTEGGEAGESERGLDLAALDAAYDRFVARVATEERLRAVVAERYLDWLRLDGDVAWFPDLDTAREALLCVREDGWSLEDATRAGRGVRQRRRLVVEEFEPDLRHHLVRARAGDVVGPLAFGDGFALVHVHEKVPPTIDDEEVHAKASALLVTAAAAREVRERVQWHHPR